MSANEEGFYIVWNPHGQNPSRRHSGIHEAKREAERLAALHPGEKFYVLTAISVSTKVSVTTQELELPLPF